ncbi:hypothetical protein [Leifsonia aquatica]|uniref:hypothetical protein n=1 Tax=Leifsonia aquatica TaxID=144185 RepID=UPI00380E4517
MNTDHTDDGKNLAASNAVENVDRNDSSASYIGNRSAACDAGVKTCRSIGAGIAMTIATYNVGFTSQKERLTKFIDAIVSVTDSLLVADIDKVLAASAQVCNVTPSQMKYALTFADADGKVKIDFDEAKVLSVQQPALVG